MSEEASSCCWMPRMAFLRQRSNLVEPIFVLDEDSETNLSDISIVEPTVERTHDSQSPVDAQEKGAEVETNGPSCAICHDTHQSMATIDCCSHSFCFPCTKEWSERENTCPLCKKRFTTIHHFDENNEPVATEVEDKNQQQADGSAPNHVVSYRIGYGESVFVMPYGQDGPAFRLSISSDGHPTLEFANMLEGDSSATSTGSE